MASLYLTPFLSFPRYTSNWQHNLVQKISQVQGFRLQTNKWGLAARKKITENLTQDAPNEDDVVVKKKTSRSSKRTRKKTVAEDDSSGEVSIISVSDKDSKKPRQRTRKKAASATDTVGEENAEKKVTKRKTKKKVDEIEDQVSEAEDGELEESRLIANVEDESDDNPDFEIDEGEDISFTYGWPPLVCCFGAAQHAFVPSGRPSNRLIDYEIHERMKDALWAPEKFVRAPGGSAGSVAIALASLGGKVAFMGKLGDDEHGQAMLYYMNFNNVQTRSVRIDPKKMTAMSSMKISKRGRLRTTCVKRCAEDSFSKNEINIDVLKEAKMFYFTTHSLLDQNMRLTTLRAIKISKKLGGVIFYDVNLSLPLWHSSEETKMFIQEVWNLADIIEVTKQELEFLCGIKPTEEFDTKDNSRSKFVHYRPEVVAPLWHNGLKVLFVTNGTSKIHYYTKEYNGSVRGMEDAPITPFTSDMSASGDGIVAALLRMLTVQPHKITDEGYLRHTIKYAINCGITDQWLLGRALGFPPKEGMEEEVVPDSNGIKSTTEREYRTLQPSSSS